LRLEEADRHAREREFVRRTAVLRNDGAATTAVRLEWRTAVETAAIEGGTMRLALPPRRETRVKLELRMPAARRAVRLRVAIEARGAGGARARLESWMRVYPARQELPWAFLKSRRIGVLDPRGELTRRLRELGGRPEALPSPTAAGNFDGDLLVIGEEALRDEGEWSGFEAALMKREPASLPPAVVVLYQGYGITEEKRETRGRIRPTAAGAGLFRELEADDLAGWREEGWVAWGPFLAVQNAERPGGEKFGKSGRVGKVRVLAWAEKSESGIERERETVALEEALPGGNLLVRCQVPLVERWAREPACENLLNALMRYGLGAKENGGMDKLNGMVKVKIKTD
jgi:hypothetical protein